MTYSFAYFDINEPGKPPCAIAFRNDRKLYLPSTDKKHISAAGYDGVFICAPHGVDFVLYPAAWLMGMQGVTSKEIQASLGEFLNSKLCQGFFVELENEGFFNGEVRDQ